METFVKIMWAVTVAVVVAAVWLVADYVIWMAGVIRQFF